jgi:hypothetical protein
MAWFKVDDGFFSSRKVLSISRELRPSAIGIWTLVGTWSAHEMTDGFVADWILDEYGCTDEIRSALIQAGLWLDVDGGVQFHDWTDYQPTRAELEAKRADVSDARSRAGRAGAIKRWQNGKTIANDSKGDSKTIANDSPDPTRPEPEPMKNKFDEFWELYPRRDNKAKALLAYKKAIKSTSEEKILTAVKKFASNPNRPETKFIPMATTWLNGERWNDPQDIREGSPIINPEDEWRYLR